MAMVAVTALQAATITLTVNNVRKQTITGFGAACCDGAMCPYGTDTYPVKMLYGNVSKIGLNIMRMEISPSFKGDENASWSTYNWQGCVPSALIVKQRGGIVFGTPWSPPGAYKTNGTAQGGNAEDQGYQKGKLRTDCYDKFFPWLNSYLQYMKSKGVDVDAVSIQNEPDWWVSYSGCLYDPQDLAKLVKNYAYMLDRETYPGVKLISGESLGFTQNYTDPLMNDPKCREQIDIVAGHLYGHPPLDDGNMKDAAVLAAKYGKEVWMTEHSVTDNIDHLPNWNEQLTFAKELNECMNAGCTGYIYWYMRAHWAFVGTGEAKYNPGNTKNKLLPRAYVMSHFSKHVTGSTRLKMSGFTIKTDYALQSSAYIKGDSLIVMAINASKNDHEIDLKLPVKVESGTHLISTGNEADKLCQESPIAIEAPVNEVTVSYPAYSLNTYIFRIENSSTAIRELKQTGKDGRTTYYDLHGRRLEAPIPADAPTRSLSRSLYIEKRTDGTVRKVRK